LLNLEVKANSEIANVLDSSASNNLKFPPRKTNDLTPKISTSEMEAKPKEVPRGYVVHSIHLPSIKVTENS
jgi:hypothetical protein